MKRQFATSVYVIHENKVLLLHHRKFNKWLPPGGHVDPNELPSNAAIREAMEETGLEIELINHSPYEFSFPNAHTLPTPYMMLLEDIPSSKKEEQHQHIDFVFLGKYISGSILANERETLGVRWFTKQEVNDIPEEDLFPDVRIVLDKLLS
ncbi:Putative 8-oxo-dGTP diphosphatase [Chlamydiales bacterium SCGC AB-751-O23]|jgi:8-oxo-dGTP pyrophosphatase MutT (NUDIX family)|nr:Putative 8-oxo-dGTP diphosphatase [Chlamydiales bacterium SCGC AB-751-O23]